MRRRKDGALRTNKKLIIFFIGLVFILFLLLLLVSIIIVKNFSKSNLRGELGSTSVFSSDAEDRSLIAYYPFEGNADDASSNGNNGVNYGATFVNGRIGQGINLSGNNYIDAGYNSSLALSSFSASVWFKFNGDNPPSMYTTLLSKSGSGSGWEVNYMIFIYNSSNGNRVGARVGAGNSENYFSSNADVNDGKWHNTVLIYDSATGIGDLYLDNISQNPTTGLPSAYTNISHNLTIGSWMITPSDGYGYFKGVIDEVKIWDYVLSDDEINTEYQRGGQNIENLVAYYPFEGNFNDMSGNNNYGVNNGTEFVPGKVGQAASFNKNASIDCGNDSSLTIRDNITISLWIYPKGNVTGYATHPINKQSDINDANYVFYFFGDSNDFCPGYSGCMTWISNVGGNWIGLSNIYTTSLNNWYHVVWTYSNSTGGLMYVNGNPVGSPVGVGAGLLAQTSAPMLIDDGGFNGTIDEVKIWNYSLSENEIKNEYNCSYGCSGATPYCNSNVQCVQCLNDNNCNSGLICNENGQCIATNNDNSGGNSGGPGPSSSPKKCIENWSCGNWSLCNNNIQSRNCIDKNKCNTILKKPLTSISCVSTQENSTENPQGVIDKNIVNFVKINWLLFLIQIIVIIAIIIIIILLIIQLRLNRKNKGGKSDSTKIDFLAGDKKPPVFIRKPQENTEKRLYMIKAINMAKEARKNGMNDNQIEKMFRDKNWYYKDIIEIIQKSR